MRRSNKRCNVTRLIFFQKKSNSLRSLLSDRAKYHKPTERTIEKPQKHHKKFIDIPKKMFARKERDTSGKKLNNIVLSLEGNIGSGKSSLLPKLAEACEELFGKGSVVIMPEPVGVWQEFTGNGMSQLLKDKLRKEGEYVLLRDDISNSHKDADSEKNVLEMYYSKDRAKYAFIMQVIANSSRIKTQTESFTAPIVLMERHSGSDGLFIRVCHENGDMTDMEADACLFFVNALYKLLPTTPGALIHLNTSAETCMKRISTRNRPGEIGGISQGYLTQLSEAHKKWLSSTPLPSFEVDGNLDISERDKTWELNLRDVLLEFLKVNFKKELDDHFEMIPFSACSYNHKAIISREDGVTTQCAFFVAISLIAIAVLIF